MSFQSDVNAAAKRIEKDVATIGRRVVRAWFDGTVKLTPVDTGRLQGNWQVSRGTPKGGELSRTGDSGPLSDIKTVVIGPDNYWLVNNLPYAPVVEYGRYGKGAYTTQKTAGTGFSIQAPRGMARISLTRVRAGLRRLGVK